MWHLAWGAGLTAKLRQLRWAPRACALKQVALGSVLSQCGVCVSMLDQMAGAGTVTHTAQKCHSCHVAWGA